MQTTSVTTSQLRIRPNFEYPEGCSPFVLPNSKHNDFSVSTYAALQDASQFNLELLQEEVAIIDLLILRQLSTRCLNHFRSFLLVHDKHILCMIRKELANLVA